MSHTNDTLPLLGLVTALESETKALCGNIKLQRDASFQRGELQLPHGRVICIQCGTGPERSLSAGRKLVAEGAEMLICAGMASGLDPSVTNAELLVTQNVILAHEDAPLPIPVDEDLLDLGVLLELINVKVTAFSQPLLTTPTPLFNMVKRMLWFERSGAVATDMESAGVALAAMEAKLPFLAIRAICDTVKRPISDDVLAACAASGTSMFSLLRSVVRHPSLLSDLWKTGRDYSRAMETLKATRDGLFEACFQAVTNARKSKPALPTEAADMDALKEGALKEGAPEEPIQ